MSGSATHRSRGPVWRTPSRQEPPPLTNYVPDGWAGKAASVGGLPINSSSIRRVGKAGPMSSLLRSIVYIPHWLPTATHPVGMDATRSRWLGWVGGCPGLGRPFVCCHLAGPSLLPHSVHPPAQPNPSLLEEAIPFSCRVRLSPSISGFGPVLCLALWGRGVQMPIAGGHVPSVVWRDHTEAWRFPERKAVALFGRRSWWIHPPQAVSQGKRVRVIKRVDAALPALQSWLSCPRDKHKCAIKRGNFSLSESRGRLVRE